MRDYKREKEMEGMILACDGEKLVWIDTANPYNISNLTNQWKKGKLDWGNPITNTLLEIMTGVHFWPLYQYFNEQDRHFHDRMVMLENITKDVDQRFDKLNKKIKNIFSERVGEVIKHITKIQEEKEEELEEELKILMKKSKEIIKKDINHSKENVKKDIDRSFKLKLTEFREIGAQFIIDESHGISSVITELIKEVEYLRNMITEQRDAFQNMEEEINEYTREVARKYSVYPHIFTPFNPQNENGVILLFGRIFENLGFDKIIEINQNHYPDVIAVRGGEKVRVEIEYLSSNFILHGHDPKECDYVVCWKKDVELPLPIIEISSCDVFKNVNYAIIDDTEEDIEKLNVLLIKTEQKLVRTEILWELKKQGLG